MNNNGTRHLAQFQFEPSHKTRFNNERSFHSACVIVPSKIVVTDTSLVKVPLQLLYGYYHHQ